MVTVLKINHLHVLIFPPDLLKIASHPTSNIPSARHSTPSDLLVPKCPSHSQQRKSLHRRHQVQSHPAGKLQSHPWSNLESEKHILQHICLRPKWVKKESAWISWILLLPNQQENCFILEVFAMLFLNCSHQESKQHPYLSWLTFGTKVSRPTTWLYVLHECSRHILRIPSHPITRTRSASNS